MPGGGVNAVDGPRLLASAATGQGVHSTGAAMRWAVPLVAPVEDRGISAEVDRLSCHPGNSPVLTLRSQCWHVVSVYSSSAGVQ